MVRDTALRSSGLHDLFHGLEVDAGLFGQPHSFGGGQHIDVDNQIVGELGNRSRAESTEVKNVRTGCGENWPASFERGLITTDHVAKRFGDRAALAAADFGVDERHAFARSLLGELAHRTWMNGAVNDDYAASFGSAECATLAKERGFDLPVVHDDDFDDFPMSSDLIG